MRAENVTETWRADAHRSPIPLVARTGDGCAKKS
jgi:hypothetical protein